MAAYIVRRMFYMIPLLLGVTAVVFLLFNVVGGNPAYQILGKNASQEEVRQLEHQLGLDRPLVVQYFDYLRQLVCFDFGRSWATKQKISTMIREGLVPSLSLTVPSFVIGSILSVLLSLVVAFYRNRLWDRIIVILCVMGMSISILVYIIAGQYYLSFAFGLFPISGWEPGLKGIPFLVLPAGIWIIVGLGSDVRFYRTVILDQTGKEYVLTARAKGVSERLVMLKHVLKNAMIPIVASMTMALPFLFTGSLLLESFSASRVWET